MPILSKLVVSLQVNHSKFSQGLNSAKGKLRQFNKSTESVSRGLTRMSVVTAAAGAGLALMIKSAIDSADNFAKMSQSTGIAVEDLSTLEHAANLSGSSLEGLGKAAKGVAVAALEAGNGLKTYTRIFEALNVEYKNSDGTLRGTKDIIFDVADQFSKMADGTKKSALAVRLFGRAGLELIPLLNQGADGIRRMQKESRDFGNEVSGDTARAAEQFNDDLLRLKKAASGAGLALAVDLLPSLTVISKAMAGAAREGGLLNGLFIGFGALIHEMAGGEIGQINRDIEGLNGEIGVLQNRLSAVNGIVPFADALFGSADEIRAEIEKIESKIKLMEGVRERLLNPPEKPQTKNGALNSSGETDDGSDAEKIKKQFDGVIESLEREQALLTDNSQIAQIRYDLESGKLKDLNADQKIRIADLAEELDFNKAIIAVDKEAADALQELKDEQEDYNAALNQQAESLKAQFDPLGELNKELSVLDELLSTGRISWEVWAYAAEQANNSAEDALDKLSGKAEEATDKIGEFSLEAARNIQQSMADFLFDPFADGVDGMINGFEMAIRRMAANVAAAQLGKSLFGDFDTTGSIGGFIGDLIPAFAGGTNFAPGGLAVVGERGPELVNLPRGSQVTPNNKIGGSTTINQTFNVSGQSDRRSLDQIQAAAASGAQRALRRNG